MSPRSTAVDFIDQNIDMRSCLYRLAEKISHTFFNSRLRSAFGNRPYTISIFGLHQNKRK